jgi:hypothetical protein
MQAHGKKSGNTVLFESAKAFKKEVRALRGSQRMMRISLLQQDALAIKEDIAQFASTDILHTLDTALRDAATASTEKELGYVARKTTGEEIATLIAETDSLIALQLGAIMAPFMTSDPSFYAGFLNAKQVKNRGTRREKKETADAQVATPEAEGKAVPAAANTAKPEGKDVPAAVNTAKPEGKDVPAAVHTAQPASAASAQQASLLEHAATVPGTQAFPVLSPASNGNAAHL